MASKTKTLRVYGEVPIDYSGPVYYRTADHGVTRRTIYGYEKFEKGPLYDERKQLDIQGTIRGRSILKPGIIVDDNGELLPKWRTPGKVTITKNKPLPYDLYAGVSGMMTERIHDAIVSLEPHEHIFFPFDATFPNGEVERMYSMQYGKAFLAAQFLEPECFFSTTKHRIETGRYADGRSYFNPPDFMLMGGTFSNDFFYLNRKVIGQRHLFTSDFGAAGGWVTYFSQQLMDKFAAFGDIFSKNCDCVRIGVAD